MKFASNLYLKIGLILASFAALAVHPIYQALRHKKPNLAVFGSPSSSQIKNTLKEINDSQSTLEITLRDQLAEQNSQLVARIPITFPQIHPVQWENAMKAIQRLKENDDLLCSNPVLTKSDDEITTLIQSTLAEYSIDPSRVEIEFVTTPGSFLSACQGLEKNKIRHIMRVNRQVVAQKSLEVITAYLRHEIQHLLTYDAIELMIIKDVLEKNEISSQAYYANQDFIELKKFKEYRADLLAATNGMSTAQAFMEDMEERIKQYPHEQINPTHSTHPTETQRKQALANLMQYLQEENKLVLA